MPSANISDSVAKSFDKTDWTFLYHGLNVFPENVGSLQKSRAEFEMHVLRDASPYWSSTTFPEIMIVVLSYTVTCQQLVVAKMAAWIFDGKLSANCLSMKLRCFCFLWIRALPCLEFLRCLNYPVLGCWGSAWWPELTESSCEIYFGRRGRLQRSLDITDLPSSICIDSTAAWSACVIKAVIAFLSIMTISTRTSQMLPEVRRGHSISCQPRLHDTALAHRFGLDGALWSCLQDASLHCDLAEHPDWNGIPHMVNRAAEQRTQITHRHAHFAQSIIILYYTIFCLFWTPHYPFYPPFYCLMMSLHFYHVSWNCCRGISLHLTEAVQE